MVPLKSKCRASTHHLQVTPDQKHLVVTDYFVQAGDISVLNTPADFKAQYIDLLEDGSLHFNRSIDFNGADVSTARRISSAADANTGRAGLPWPRRRQAPQCGRL